VPAHLNGDEIAIAGARCGVGGNRKFAAELLLVDRNQAAATARERTENTKRAMLGAVDQLYDPSGRFLIGGVFDANERAIADAGNFVRARAALRMDADDRRRAVSLFVPLSRAGQEFAVAVTAGNVGKNDRRQSAGVMQPFALAIDVAFIGQVDKHAFERGAISVLGAEGARDFTDADLAAVLADEGDKFLT
jgi:hypothetical protein